MPKYIFDAIVPPEAASWLAMQSYAERCGLKCTQEGEWRFCFSGDVSPFQARHFADSLKQRRVSYRCRTKPSLSALHRVHLEDVCLERSDKRRAAELHSIEWMMGVKYVAGLSQCLFDSVMGRVRQEPGFLLLPPLTEILRFMIAYGIEFRDLSPGKVFRTPMGELEIAIHARHPLQRVGFRWVELLPHVKGRELLTIRGMGVKGVSVVESSLAQCGMRLRS